MGTKEIDILTVQDFLNLVRNERLWLSDISFYFPFDDDSNTYSIKVLSQKDGDTIIELKNDSSNIVINDLIKITRNEPLNKLLFYNNGLLYYINGFDYYYTNNCVDCVFLLNKV